jgi:8-oxo-dGTP diphosphatase
VVVSDLADSQSHVVWQSASGYHENAEKRNPTPHSVLVFPILDHHLVFVRHPFRGWEVPGGKVESHESPEQAVRREAWEESGLILTALQWIAEYQIQTTGGPRAKWIYIAHVYDIKSRPPASEMIDVQLFRPVISPSEARRRSDISPVLQDDIYALVWPNVCSAL